MSRFLEHYGCSCIVYVDDKLEIVIEVGFRQTTLLVFLPKFVYLIDFVYNLEKNDNLMIEFLNMNYAFQRLDSIDNTVLNEAPKM